MFLNFRHINIPGLTVFCDSKVDEHFLSLEHLGMMLKRLPGVMYYYSKNILYSMFMLQFNSLQPLHPTNGLSRHLYLKLDVLI